MKNCQYKSLLAIAHNKTPMLPLSPNAYFGTVIHNVLEGISKGEISNDLDLSNKFNVEIENMENRLEKLNFKSIIPLKKTVSDYGIKVVLLKKYLKFNVEPKKNDGKRIIQTEYWLETKDKLIGGKVDLLIEYDLYTEIIDFKTGAITQDYLDDSGEIFTEIKSGYSDQLKLYAYAYYETKGRFPDKLTLVDLAKQRFYVSFTHEECKALYEEAKSLLLEVNKTVKTKEFKANVSEENCRFCLYRPGCSFYLNYLEVNPPFNDVVGILSKFIKYQNGNISLYVENKAGSYTVTGIRNADIDIIERNKEKKISIFNLKKESTNNVYSSRRTTTII